MHLHIKGIDNVWADLLGRWSAYLVGRHIFSVPVLVSSSDAEFDWPTPASFGAIQEQFITDEPINLQYVEGLWENAANAIWIPEKSENMQLRIFIAAHTGLGGHRGQNATEFAIRAKYFWYTLTVDVRIFVKSCIHCLSTTGSEKIPRPFGPAMYGNDPNGAV